MMPLLNSNLKSALISFNPLSSKNETNHSKLFLNKGGLINNLKIPFVMYHLTFLLEKVIEVARKVVQSIL